MKVSIIIPCYNGAVFLPKTIQSVIQQTYKDIEIIIINDCSTDNSLSIMKSFAKVDNRIVIIDKKINEGVDYARFSGINIANGDYLAFLDADDWLRKDAVQTWIDIALNQNVDIVYANNIRVFSQTFGIKRTNKFDINYTERIISGNEKAKLFISFFGVNIVPVTMWGNLFKRTLFTNNLKKSGLKFGEDLLLGMQLYHNASSIYLTNKPLTYYRWGGVTAKFQPNFITSVKSLFEYKIEFIEKINLRKERNTAIIELANCLATHVSQLATYFPNKQIENITKLKKEFNDPIYDYFTEIKSNNYFKDGNLNTACVNRDYQTAYNIAYRIASQPKNRIRHSIKMICSSILKHIKL